MCSPVTSNDVVNVREENILLMNETENENVLTLLTLILLL